MNKIALTIIIGLVVIVGITGLVLTKQKDNSPSDKLSVVASFYPLAYFAEQVGGDKVTVANITPAGAEPHDYEPSTQDVAAIERSKLLILNGAGLETWGKNITETLHGKDVTVLTVGSEVATRQVEEEGELQQDPHIWLDPVLAQTMVQKITTTLVILDPAHKAYYEANQSRVEAALTTLDDRYRTGLQSCKKKDFVTSHVAFGYLAQRYDLNQIAIAGVSPDEEPSSQDLADVSKFVKDHNVKYIFFESLVSPKLSETIAKETGAQTLELNPIEGLTAEDTDQGKSYQSVMEQNLTNLQLALECNR